MKLYHIPVAILVFILGILYQYSQTHILISTVYMPVKLVDADIAHLIVLEETGGTYKRYAINTPGIIATRQLGEIWIVPCDEKMKVIGGKK